MSLKRDAYGAKMKTKLDRWNTEIDKLEIKARQAGSDSKVEFQNQVAGLQAKRTEVKEKIEGLLQAGDDAWRDLRTGVESSWRALDEAGRSAIANFKRAGGSETP